MKAGLLSVWFFFTTATLWILKPVRVASLLLHLGATETPYVRLAGMATIALVVMGYSRAVNRLPRVAVVVWANLLFAGLLAAFWVALQLGGQWLGAQRAFVWSVYILVEIYAVVLIGIFWTYANDVVTEDEANKLYAIVGVGGILGGAAGGVFVDVCTRAIGPINLLLLSAALVAGLAALGWKTEKLLQPPPRQPVHKNESGLDDALEGAREVARSPYLLLLVGIVVAYEFTATLTDFGVSVIFERAYSDQIQLTKMYGRLGWIVSGVALVVQVLIVPLLLPLKRVALLVPPIAMLAGAATTFALPIVASAIVLSMADRGLNYSMHQTTKESLYVPLTDGQKYKAKAFIDMFVDRAAKALAAFALIGVIHYWGASVRVTLAVAFVSVALWLVSAIGLGNFFNKRRAKPKANAAPLPLHAPAARPKAI